MSGMRRGGPPSLPSDVGAKPLTSADFAPPRVDERGARELVDRFRPLMAKKRGLVVPRRPQLLGVGSRGTAFDVGGGRALKVTADEKEATAALRLKTAGLRHVVRVYDVFRLGGTHVYCVVQERLEPLSEDERREFNEAIITTGLPRWIHAGGYDWDVAKRITLKYLTDKVKGIQEQDARRKFMEQANQMWSTLVGKYHMKEIAEELRSAGISFHDYHAGNMMKRAGDYVLIDVGYSKVKGGKEPDVLERLVRETIDEIEAPEYPTAPDTGRRQGDPAGEEFADRMSSVLVKNELPLRRRGVWTKGAKRLGQGSYGVAFEVGYKGRVAVVKVTADHTEAATSNHIKGRNVKHLVRVYDVFRFPGEERLYGIVQEKLTRLSDDEATKFERLVDFLEKAKVGTALLDGDIRGIKLRVRVKLGRPAAQEFDELVDEFQFADILGELVKNRILFVDYHSGNLMRRGDDFVVIDLGQSRSPGKEPPLLEGPVKKKDTSKLKHHMFGFPGAGEHGEDVDDEGHGLYRGNEIYDALEKSDAALRRNGVEVDVGARLGNGVFGIVFRGTYKGKPCAVKVTGEHGEARAANHVKGRHLKHFVNIYAVFKLRETRRPLFIVVQELLSPTTESERSLFNELLQLIFVTTDNHIDKYIRLDGSKKLVSDVMQGFSHPPMVDDRMDDWDYAHFRELADKFGILGAVDEMAKNEIMLNDIHDENILKRGNEFVFIDPGLAKSPGALPDVVERVMRGLVTEAKADQVGVTIGRFQPFHKGHAEVVRQLASKYNKVIVLIAGNRRDANNPFSYGLRVDLMRRSLPDVANKLETYKAEVDGKPSGYLPGVLGSIVRDHKSSIEVDTAVEVLVGPDRFEGVQKQFQHALSKPRVPDGFDPSLAVVRQAAGVTSDDDAGRVSGTEVREALARDDRERVASLLDPHLQTVGSEFDELYGRMRDEMQQVTGLLPQRKEESRDFVLEDLEDVGESGITAVLQQCAHLLAKRQPFQVDVSKLRRLGAGKKGVAFAMGGGKVLKVTTDEDEARACVVLLKRGSPPHVVKVFDVFKFPGGTGHDLFGIVEEELTDLSTQEKNDYDSLIWLLEDETTIDVLATEKWDAVVTAVHGFIERNVEQDMFPDGVPESIPPKRRARLEKVVGERLAEFQAWAARFNMDKINDELRSVDIGFVDYHSGNMMKRGSTFVINDLGLSRSPGTVPPLLEGRRKSTDREKSEDLGFGFNADGYPIHDRYEFAGFTVCVENKKGSKRQWGEKPSEHTIMRNDYGYFPDWDGADGDEVDVYVGPDEDAEWVYVVHQMKAPKFKKFDEDKVMLGFSSADKARKAYLTHYDDEGFFGSMSTMTLDDFRKKLRKHEGKKITNEATGLLDRLREHVYSSMGLPREAFTGTLGSLGSSQWSRPPATPGPDDTDPLPHDNTKKPE